MLHLNTVPSEHVLVFPPICIHGIKHLRPGVAGSRDGHVHLVASVKPTKVIIIGHFFEAPPPTATQERHLDLFTVRWIPSVVVDPLHERVTDAVLSTEREPLAVLAKRDVRLVKRKAAAPLGNPP
ncbi:MAG: hypothetical protein PHU43_01360 [Candidatus Bipolaricaulis sp.]|nr:hypothetical protein [Candidatus Bipolaricaulis sp.]